MFPTNLPYRQVHLDFHTSEHCLNVGGDFSEKNFRAALRLGRVKSINFFACCHHGWVYYPNSSLGISHPNLKTDLVGRMIQVCREEGVNAEVYITVGWNERAARQHPEWCIRRPDGMYQDCPPEGHPDSPRPWGWKRLCVNTDYLNDVLTVTKEILERYDPPGIWYDITGQPPCTCAKCTADMEKLGLDPTNSEDQRKFAEYVYKKYLQKTTELVWSHNPKTTVYHNGSSLKARHDIYPFDSHIEIESLPTGGWGYDHFPSNARYFTQLPTQVVGMTGKFHQSWGEFGGFKNPVALRYECAQIVSLGCLACTGDQLHPSGKMDLETYRIIGDAYEYIETREPWLKGATVKADVAVLGTMEMFHDGGEGAILGAGKMLMEAQIPHTVIDETMSFDGYKFIILPDKGRLDPGVRDKLNRFMEKGGKLLLSAESGLEKDAWKFALDTGLICEGKSPWDVEYVKARKAIAKGLVSSPFLLYKSGIAAKPDGTGEILADTVAPMFNRTWAHFCSHRNTPPGETIATPSAIQKWNLIYIAQPIFSMYNSDGMKLHRDYVLNCIERLYPRQKSLLSVDGLQSCGRASVTHQEEENRDIIHLLYATPVKRGCVEVIEDIVTTGKVTVRYRCETEPKSVKLVPENKELKVKYAKGFVEFTVPNITMAQMVSVEY